MENSTAKHFVLQLGALASLYLSVTFLLVLLFGLINIGFPDTNESLWEIESAQDMVRIGIAMTIVFFPTYLILTRTVNKIRRKETEGKYLGLTKWLIYLSLLGGGLVLLIDLVIVIMSFLEGELSERFILKALAVLITIGLAFYYYIKDAQGYWLTREKQSLIFGLVATIIVVGAIVVGGFNIDTPAEVREASADQIVQSTLQDMQWQVENYYQVEEVLPEDIESVFAPLTVPGAPDGRTDYTYEKTSDTEFTLCGEFANESMADSQRFIPEKNYDWRHGAGVWCFDREIEVVEIEVR